MPATITLKNIPDAVHLALKEAAQASHRSLNDEVLVRLEQSLHSNIANPQTHVDCAHALRLSLGAVARAKIAKIDIVKAITADRDRH